MSGEFLGIQVELVLAGLILLFGILNYFLWYLVINPMKSSGEEEAKKVMKRIMFLEDRLTDLVSNLQAQQKEWQEFKALYETKSTEVSAGLGLSDLDPLRESLGRQETEIEELRNFVEALDGHLVEILKNFK
ncbi:MAG TPA: hypothetical protein VJC03_04345 [bacterium]|nr:hypothetical protein [bacterium]